MINIVIARSEATKQSTLSCCGTMDGFGGVYHRARIRATRFREREPQITENLKAMMLTTPVEGYLACCEALSTFDNRALLPTIKIPTLVIAGRHDMSAPVAAGEVIRSQIPGASMTILDAAHISNIEQPHAFTDAVVGFLTQR